MVVSKWPNLFLLTLFLLLLLSVGSAYYKYMVLHDYEIYITADEPSDS